MNRNQIFCIVLVSILIGSLMAVIHEFGHIFFCLLTGGRTLKIGYQDSLVGGIFYTYNQYPNKTARTIVSIGGSLFECTMAFILCKIIYKTKKAIILFFGIGFSFISNSLIWGISTIIKFGDGYIFSTSIGIDPLFISIPFLIGTVINYIILNYYWFKLLDYKNNLNLTKNK